MARPMRMPPVIDAARRASPGWPTGIQSACSDEESDASTFPYARKEEGCPRHVMKEHPEDQRLSAAKPLVATLYTRPGCHLCEEAKAVVEPLLAEFGAELCEVNIEGDAVLTERYGR